MPNSWPSRSRARAASRVSCAARGPSRSICSWLVARRYAAHSRAAGPDAVKYSAFAENVTGRSSISGRKTESTTDWWLAARIAPPDAGMFSAPVTLGRQIVCRNGPATIRDSWYCTGPLSSFLLAHLGRTIAVRGGGQQTDGQRQRERQGGGRDDDAGVVGEPAEHRHQPQDGQ